MMNFVNFFLLSCAILGFSSCSLFKPPSPPPKASHVMYEWYDDLGTGEIAININLTTQKAQFTRGGRPIGWCYVSTGKEGHGTPAGNYSITEKMEEKFSNKYGWVSDEFGNNVNGDATPKTPLNPGEIYNPAAMKYWQRLTSYGIGMHIGPIPAPGEPASHGCIRMPAEFKPKLYAVTKVGTPVKISYGREDFLRARVMPLATAM